MKQWSLHQPADRNWLLLSSLVLSSSEDTWGQIESWLVKTLQLLTLSPDFSGKVLASVLDAINKKPVEVQYIRLLVYTPAILPADRHTWGYFRMMKNENMPPDQTDSENSLTVHTVMLYLYVEDLIGSG